MLRCEFRQGVIPEGVTQESMCNVGLMLTAIGMSELNESTIDVAYRRYSLLGEVYGTPLVNREGVLNRLKNHSGMFINNSDETMNQFLKRVLKYNSEPFTIKKGKKRG